MTTSDTSNRSDYLNPLGRLVHAPGILIGAAAARAVDRGSEPSQRKRTTAGGPAVVLDPVGASDEAVFLLALGCPDRMGGRRRV
ncbi:hypothetical protein, partial [Arthrobacter sp. SO3]|uniref:hypothetical protein n=1 Tax=Arthrobacter sp. SO3 TaxID=1897057 RepID=UPI001CFFE49A